jgi:hypothetical protein
MSHRLPSCTVMLGGQLVLSGSLVLLPWAGQPARNAVWARPCFLKEKR